MNKFDRIYSLYRLLHDRRTPIRIGQLAERLECSSATIKRLVRKLRDELGAPIETVPERGYLMQREGTSGLHELPGLWFNASELHALMTAHHLFGQVEPGVLGEQIRPLKQRIEKLLRHRRAGDPDITNRIHIKVTGVRPVERHRFRLICDALVRRRRIHVHYHSRGDDQRSERTLSPQRMTHYRANWYLEAWCHKQKDLRRFALERISDLRILEQPARDLDNQSLDDNARAYGIFSGSGKHTAVLLFSAERARWISEEQWHPDQTGSWQPDGRYQLTLPYDDPTELIMDILRHGPEVTVEAPESLRNAVINQLQQSLTAYDRPA